VPWPTAGELADAYGLDYYERYGMHASEAQRAEVIAAGHDYRVQCAERFQRPPGVFVDIGGATGGVAAAALARAWDAYAFDTSEAAVRAGRDRLGDRLRLGDIEAAFASGLRPSVLSAYHVLEHTERPRQFIERAGQMLVPGGLLVLEVPHVRSLDTRIVPRVRRTVLDLPRHLCHFTPDTLQRLLAEHGFTVLSVDGTATVLVDPLRRLRGSRAAAPGVVTTAPPPSTSGDGFAGWVRRTLSGYAFCVYARGPE